MHIIMAECKTASVYGDQMQRALKEVKDLKLTIEEAITIIALNNIDLGFDTYLAIVNDKARNDEKLPELSTIMKALQEEESRLHHQQINFSRAGAGARGSGRGGRGRGDRGGSGRGGNSRGGSSRGGRSDSHTRGGATNSTPQFH